MNFSDIIGEKIKKLALSQHTVLIKGEKGTGKEYVARAIHQASSRADQPFVEVYCDTLAEEKLEENLFGYLSEKKEFIEGKFSLANGGTLFLREIDNLPFQIQVSLLHLLQNKMFCPVGSDTFITIDFRMIVSTSKDLQSMVQSGQFRNDLYFKLGAVPLYLPPLRERKEEIPRLLDHILLDYSNKQSGNNLIIEPSFLETLTEYDWPGNLTELKQVVEHAVIACTGRRLTQKHLPKYIRFINKNETVPEETTNCTYKEQLHRWEYTLFSRYLMKYGTSTESKKQIAQELDMGIATLYRKLAQLDLS